MLLSRVADSLYWIGRYVERAEHVSRVVDIRLNLGLDRPPAGGGWNFERLYASLGLTEPAAVPSSPAALVESVFFDAANRESVIGCLTTARENAQQVREEISSEMWEHLNALFLNVKEAKAAGTWSFRPHYLSRLIVDGSYLFQGITDATMVHGEGWQYLQVGRFLERAAATAALIDQQMRDGSLTPGETVTARAQVEWAGLLRACSALAAYCRVYTADLRPDRVAEFLLLNAEFPRSVRFAAASLEWSLRTLGQQRSVGAGGRAARFAGRLHASLDYGQVDEILSDNPETYLKGVGRQCEQIHAALHQEYIGYSIESALPA